MLTFRKWLSARLFVGFPMRAWFSYVLVCLALLFSVGAPAGESLEALKASSQGAVQRVEIPEAARKTLAYVRLHRQAPPGYVGGRRFGNYERLLPQQNKVGKRLSYQEWDIYPKKNGRNRGAERIVTSNDERAWYTPDHYKSFKEMQ